MGRPRGSKNKPRTKDSEGVVAPPKPKLKPKSKPIPTSPTLDKLLAAGFTAADLKAAIKEALANGEISAAVEPVKKDSKAEARAALLAEMRKPLSPAESARLLREAKSEQALVKDPQLVVNDAVEQVIKPNWPTAQADVAGLKHFLVNSNRGGYTVSMDKEKWDLALKSSGIRGALIASKPEMGLDAEAKSVGRWRVMIG